MNARNEIGVFKIIRLNEGGHVMTDSNGSHMRVLSEEIVNFLLSTSTEKELNYILSLRYGTIVQQLQERNYRITSQNAFGESQYWGNIIAFNPDDAIQKIRKENQFLQTFMTVEKNINGFPVIAEEISL